MWVRDQCWHGVGVQARDVRLQAYIRVGGKHVHLGCHDGELAAAQAFDQAAMLRSAHCPGPQSGAGDAALVTNFTPAFYQVRELWASRGQQMFDKAWFESIPVYLDPMTVHRRGPAKGTCHSTLCRAAQMRALMASLLRPFAPAMSRH